MNKERLLMWTPLYGIVYILKEDFKPLLNMSGTEAMLHGLYCGVCLCSSVLLTVKYLL